MTSPTINNYLETLSNPAGRFDTLGGIEVVRDPDGQPLYTVRSRTLDAAVRRAGREWILCCPLHGAHAVDLQDYVRNRYLRASRQGGEEAFRLLVHEMLVFDDRDGRVRCDVLLVEAPATALTRKAPAVAESPAAERVEVETPYREGLAAARSPEGKYGLVDRQGREVVPFRYDWADAPEEGLAVVRVGDRVGLIDKKGHPVLDTVFEDIRWHADNGVVMASDEEGVWRLYTREGRPVGEAVFDFIFDFSGGLASVRNGDKYGYIDRAGTLVIPCLYDEAYTFSDEGLATVVQKGRVFTIDTEGMVFD